MPQQSLQFGITYIKQECSRLKSRIVHNPEQLKQVAAHFLVFIVLFYALTDRYVDVVDDC
jgi:hypothetical protein